MREGLLSCVTGKWQETNRKPVPWLMFVMSLGAGAAAAILEIQLCKIFNFAKLEWTNFQTSASWTPRLSLGSTCEW